MNKTSIEWTHRPGTTGMTWNPIRARRVVEVAADGDQVAAEHEKTGTFCTRISPGCKNCYASTINKRFGTGLPFELPHLADHEFYIDQRILEEPLKRKKPATIFVGDMFDLFHEAIPSELITQVLRIPDIAKQHTFQFLTKRAGRMYGMISDICACAGMACPPGNMWFGVSVESQKYADERIPLLLETPAAIRFLSVEPLLEAVNLRYAFPCPGSSHAGVGYIGAACACMGCSGNGPSIDWVICGGESGPGARPFNTKWADSLLSECRAASVPFFMKQLGSHVIQGGERRTKRDSKGGDMHEWPHELRVREFPA